MCRPGTVSEIQKHLYRAQAESQGKAAGQQKLLSSIPLSLRESLLPPPLLAHGGSCGGEGLGWQKGGCAEEG